MSGEPDSFRDVIAFLKPGSEKTYDAFYGRVENAAHTIDRVTRAFKSLFSGNAPADEPDLDDATCANVYCRAAQDMYTLIDLYDYVVANNDPRRIYPIFGEAIHPTIKAAYQYFEGRTMTGALRGKKYTFYVACLMIEMERRASGPSKTFAQIRPRAELFDVRETSDKQFLDRIMPAARSGFRCG